MSNTVVSTQHYNTLPSKGVLLCEYNQLIVRTTHRPTTEDNYDINKKQNKLRMCYKPQITVYPLVTNPESWQHYMKVMYSKQKYILSIHATDNLTTSHQPTELDTYQKAQLRPIVNEVPIGVNGVRFRQVLSDQPHDVRHL